MITCSMGSLPLALPLTALSYGDNFIKEVSYKKGNPDEGIADGLHSTTDTSPQDGETYWVHNPTTYKYEKFTGTTFETGKTYYVCEGHEYLKFQDVTPNSNSPLISKFSVTYEDLLYKFKTTNTGGRGEVNFKGATTSLITRFSRPFILSGQELQLLFWKLPDGFPGSVPTEFIAKVVLTYHGTTNDGATLNFNASAYIAMNDKLDGIQSGGYFWEGSTFSRTLGYENGFDIILRYNFTESRYEIVIPAGSSEQPAPDIVLTGGTHKYVPCIAQIYLTPNKPKYDYCAVEDIICTMQT